MSSTSELTPAETASTYPIAKQIMLGRWVLLEPAVYALFLLCIIALFLGGQSKPTLRKKPNEIQSIHAH
ncbi:MAG: hypothetical protein JST35_01290 [Armatimonadetes bacterium]|nr:hypothetical protein [Armatimonadota bacterium]